MNFNIKSNLIEKVFPLSKLDGGFLISKSSDVTICLELTLIESFTSDVDRYKTLHNCFVSGMRDFPNYTIIHKHQKSSRLLKREDFLSYYGISVFIYRIIFNISFI